MQIEKATVEDVLPAQLDSRAFLHDEVVICVIDKAEIYQRRFYPLKHLPEIP